MSSKTASELLAHYPILAYFDPGTETGLLGDVHRSWSEVAWELADFLPVSAEASVGFRKLLEAKDCFVRAALSARDAAREES